MLHRFITGALALSLLVAACGSNDSDDGGGGTYSLESVCEDIAPKICNLRKSCCTSSGIGYDEAGCLAEFKADCQQDVAAAKAGTETFDGTKVDACLAAFEPILTACRISMADLEDYIPAVKSCTVFVGQKDLGAACTRDNECKPSADPDTFVSCNDQGKCAEVRYVGEGAACSFEDGNSAICKDGLYCAFTSLNPPEGTCKKATSKGATCTVISGECGFGYICDPGSKTCVDAKGEGQSCTTGLECSSLNCAGGSCAAPDPVVDAAECGK